MRNVLLTGLVLVLAACSSRGMSNENAGFGPALTIERFLNASNAVAQLSEAEGQGATRMANEIETMARLFGTADGSVLDRHPRQEVEERMFLISRILRHQDYQLAGERAVPGRSREAIEVNVRLTSTTAGPVEVPFTVVRTSQGDWLIETIALDRITMQ